MDAEWIAFLDDDVKIPRDWCRRLVRDLSDLPDQVAASQAWLYVPAPPQRRPTDGERRTMALAGALWITADMAYRRAALVATGGFDERFPRAFREDGDLALRTVRLGYAMAWGERVTTHPLASPTTWRSSLKDQAGNADNALLRAKYGRRWRSLIGTTREDWPSPDHHRRRDNSPGCRSLSSGCAAPRRWARVAAAAGLVWAGLTAEFAIGRILAGPRTAREISTMVVTSALIPPLAVAHRLRGEVRVRLAGRDLRRFVRQASSRALRSGRHIDQERAVSGGSATGPADAGARRTLNQLRRQGVAVGVVSNQSGVARGLINSDELAKVNARVESLLGPFDTWQVCPHAPDAGCGCRKPEPGLVTAAAASWESIRTSAS